jgi:putative glutamine amidotransferase
MRPVIGVTTSSRGGKRSFSAHKLALWRAGAHAVRLTARRPLKGRRLDGLIIGGGDDIGAAIYDGEVLPDVRVDPERDELELALLARYVPAALPILGICRGAQMINVAMGGTLYTDIHEVYEKAPRMRTILPRKRVSIVENSGLNAILRCNPCLVNALHHQSVNKVGTGLRVVAYDEVNIVQALEGTSDAFLIGVQWHPELLPFSRPQQRLFDALVAAAQEGVQEGAVARGSPVGDAEPNA